MPAATDSCAARGGANFNCRPTDTTPRTEAPSTKRRRRRLSTDAIRRCRFTAEVSSDNNNNKVKRGEQRDDDSGRPAGRCLPVNCSVVSPNSSMFCANTKREDQSLNSQSEQRRRGHLSDAGAAERVSARLLPPALRAEASIDGPIERPHPRRLSAERRRGQQRQKKTTLSKMAACLSINSRTHNNFGGSEARDFCLAFAI